MVLYNKIPKESDISVVFPQLYSHPYFKIWDQVNLTYEGILYWIYKEMHTMMYKKSTYFIYTTLGLYIESIST